jgi:hypothetical protein
VTIPALIEENTVFAQNVEENIEQRKLIAVLRSCKTKDEERVQVASRAEVAMEGPRQFQTSSKRKTEDLILGPRFRRRYVWSDMKNTCSPAALDTEVATPFPPPPAHLLNDRSIQSTLTELESYVNIETPFDIDRLELFLGSHPNQPFVKSIMRSLREGFWPFDEGDWEEFPDDMLNYSLDESDLTAIRAFRDKECEARHWSPHLPFQYLLPGMKTSPMFVVWQNHKPRVITDHAIRA